LLFYNIKKQETKGQCNSGTGILGRFIIQILIVMALLYHYFKSLSKIWLDLSGFKLYIYILHKIQHSRMNPAHTIAWIFGVQSRVPIYVTCDLTVSRKTEYRTSRIKQIALKAARVPLWTLQIRFFTICSIMPV